MDIKTDKNDNNNNNNINITYSLVAIICICIFASVISITAIIVIFINIKFKDNSCDLVNVATTTSFWTDKNIDYWSNINIVRPSDDDNVKAWEMYHKQLYIRNEARLRALKCVPKEGVFKIETLISKEKVEEEKKNNNNITMVPHQKVMLRRCMPQYSYCEIRGTKCTPTEWKNKTIFAIFKLNNGNDNTMFDDFDDDYEEIMNAAINGTLSKKLYVILTFLVEEHVHCSCLCKI